jgi:hypothetical protein
MKCGFYDRIEKKGFTRLDLFFLVALIVGIITYIVLISMFPYEEYLSNNEKNIKNKYINNLRISINIIGVILGIGLSIFTSNVIFRELEINLFINIIIFIISLIFIIFYYISLGFSNYPNWLKFNYVMIPVVFNLFFMSQYSVVNIYNSFNISNSVTSSEVSSETSIFSPNMVPI